MTQHHQPLIALAAPQLGPEELEAVERVFASGRLTAGVENLAFEQEFAGRHATEHGVTFASGTVALTAMLIAAGIGPGDEVVVPSFTFISTATSVVHAGAKPIFADVEADTFCIDPADVARRLTAATRAIVAVHYGGQPADLRALGDLANDAGVLLLEDAAEAHGASHEGRPVGGQSAMAMFSFTPTKNITMGEGGLVTTDDAGLADKLRLLRNHGQTGLYEHRLIGFNWRLSEMQAAIGRVQLSRLDDILDRKHAIAERLDKGLAPLSGIAAPAHRPGCEHTYMLYTTTVERDRDRLRERLLSDGVEARLYFPPAHRQPIFDDDPVDLPVTDWLAEHALSLPAHSGLSDSDIDTVLDRVASHLT